MLIIFIMEATDFSSKLITKLSVLINLLMTLVVFALFTFYLIDFVPIHEKQNPLYAVFWSAFTSVCLSGVFWLSASMFSVVLIDYRNRRAKDSH